MTNKNVIKSLILCCVILCTTNISFANFYGGPRVNTTPQTHSNFYGGPRVNTTTTTRSNFYGGPRVNTNPTTTSTTTITPQPPAQTQTQSGFQQIYPRLNPYYYWGSRRVTTPADEPKVQEPAKPTLPDNMEKSNGIYKVTLDLSLFENDINNVKVTSNNHTVKISGKKYKRQFTVPEKIINNSISKEVSGSNVVIKIPVKEKN